jgi:competence protein ComEC
MPVKFRCLVLAIVLAGLVGCGRSPQDTVRDDEPSVENSAEGEATLDAPKIGGEEIPTGNPYVYITRTGDRYHTESCASLRKSKIPILLGEAKDKGYRPCARCKPPE